MSDSYINAKAKWAKVNPDPWPGEWTAEAWARMEMDAAAARAAEAAAAAARAQAKLERAKEVVDMEMAAGMNAPTPTAVEAIQRAMVAYNTAAENSSAAINDLIEKMQEQIDAQNTLTAATGVTAVAAMNSSPKKRRKHSKKRHKISEASASALPLAHALPPVPAPELLRYINGGTNTKKSYRRYKKRKTKHYKKKTKRYTKK
jgi:hypothetical protein